MSAKRIVTVLALAALLTPVAAAPAETAAKMRIIVDADTSNEVDDLYAIVRALVAPELDIVGLASAHWQISHWATPTTLEDSQRINEVLLGFFERMDIPHPRGAQTRLYDWGADVAQHSAAAYHLIRQAHATPEGEKLTVAVLGASTNVASALLIDPTIAPKLRLYLLGTRVDAAKGVWSKVDFNVMNDINAINVILDAVDLETHVMPANVAVAMGFSMEEVRERLAGREPVLDFLHRRWVEHVDPGRYERVIWDLSLIEAILHPELATEQSVSTPPENTPREVSVYTSIDAAAMKADFYSAIDAHFGARD